MLLTRVAVPLLACFISACASPSSGLQPFESGTSRVGLAANITSVDAEADSGGTSELNSFEANLNWGRFVAPKVELGFTTGISSTEQDGDESDLALLGGYGRFYFNSDATVRPYVGLDLGGLAGSTDTLDVSGNFFNVNAGLLTFFNSNVALDTRITRGWTSQDFDDGVATDTVTTDAVAVVVGLSFFY
jgi:hypothetical protein